MSLKDNEVDVFAWRPPGDGRRGQLILMCQCAIGAGWNDKGIRLEKWDPFVLFAVTPIGASAFPFVPKAMEDDPKYDHVYLSRSVGLWFDRLRRRDAKIDWKALSERIGHSDVAFTMRQYVQTDLDVHRQVATALAELILGGVLSDTGEEPVPRRSHASSRAQIRAQVGYDKAPGY